MKMTEAFTEKWITNFKKKKKNRQQANFEQDYSFCKTDDRQPELYDPASRNLVVFDKFDDSAKYVDRFKKTLKNFGGSENQLFDSVI